MTTEPTPTASPVCYLDEVEDRYLGYATADEIRQIIARWARRPPAPAIAQALAAIMPAGMTIIDMTTAADAATGCLSAEDLRQEIYSFLPKLRDDALHGALQRLLAMI